MILKECFAEGQYWENIGECEVSVGVRELMGEGICVNTTARIIEDREARGKLKKVNS
jgi:hypothetical protein